LVPSGGRLAVIAAGCLTLAHCGGPFSIDPKLGVSSSPRVVEGGDPVPKGGGTYHLGKPNRARIYHAGRLNQVDDRSRAAPDPP
jgi:hypothetical protein